MQASPDELRGRIATGEAMGLLNAVRATWRGYDMPLREIGAAAIELETGQGRIRLDARRAGLGIRIRAGGEANAFMLREALIGRIEEFDPALLASLRWSERVAEGGLPPNFRVGRVRQVASLGPLFWRLVIEASDLAPFARDGLHLRLALPRRGRRPVWPRVDRAGRTRWPAAPDDLHVAVYTIRDIDPEAGTLTVDAFRHGRGATCAWLAGAEPGDPLGLLGPGGGWLPEAPHLTLAGDETALPAIARILEAAPRGSRGSALLEAERPGELPEVAAPPGIALRRLSRRRGESLEDAIAAADLGGEGRRHVWFAAEQRRAAAMRAALRAGYGIGRTESTVASYWTAR